MPIICTFRGITVSIRYDEHMPPHFHATYAEYECSVDIEELEKMNGVIKVVPTENYTLLLTFDNGEVRSYDMSEKMVGVLNVLKDKSTFNRVFLDPFGNVVWDIDKNVDSSKHWENRIDLCKDALYEKSTPV